MVKSINLTINYKNKVIQSHSIYGQYLMPGLGYIDMLYQLGDKLGIRYQTHSIHNLQIENPLIVPKDKQVELTIVFEQKEDVWFVKVQGEDQMYASAEFHLETKCYTDVISLEMEKEKADTVFQMDSIYENARTHELIHTGIMKVLGKCYLTDEQLYMELKVSEEYNERKGEYVFHPALIDGAGMASGAIRGDGEDSENLYIPLCYEYFYSTEQMGEKCFARVKKTSIREKNEIRSSDLEFYNEDGKQIGELLGITSKKIRNRQQIQAKPKAESKKPIVSLEEKKDIKKIEKKDDKSIEALEYTLKKLFSKYIGKEPQSIERNVGFFEIGLESAQLLNLHQDIETELGIKLNQTTLFEYTSIQELAEYIQTVQAKANDTAKEMVSFEEFDEEPDKNCYSSEDIAVIGMAGYFPEAKNIEEFWNNLKEGKDCIVEVPEDRWDWRDYEDIQTPTGKPISKWGGFIDNVAEFDAEFFRVSPREAEIIDPQERLFLQCCWKAMEDAGYTPDNVCEGSGRKVGVYVGVMHKDYALIGLDVLNSGRNVPLSLNYAPIANRVSYFCDFHGPSMALDTVCSSSLLSIQLAIDSIRKGESEVALAGGVNVSLHPAKYISYGLAGMHSSNGACRTFGTDADGYVSSEGIGAVLLKPLSKAIEDRDNIYAVIKNVTVNHGGRASGLTVPSPAAQGNLIYDCLREANINPRTIQYMEAHGTGTSLGDPIEIQGLMNAYSKFTAEKQYCAIGSVKSNIGHTESAAGVAGLIKVCLQLYYKTLVPSLHSEVQNPILNFEDSAFYIQHKTEFWERQKIEVNGKLQECKRRAAISAFGATGTNVHAVLEEYEPEYEHRKKQNKEVCFMLSAKNEERLQAYLTEFLSFLSKQKEEEFSLEDMVYTLHVGRVEFDERIAIVVNSLHELIETLTKLLEDKTSSPNVYKGNVRKVDTILKQLMGNEDWNELVDKWIAHENVEQIARLWVAGMPVDWTQIYKDKKAYRMSLPTYAFANTKYWLKSDNGDVSVPERKKAKKNVVQLESQTTSKKLSDIYNKKNRIKKPVLIEQAASEALSIEENLKTWLSEELNIMKEQIDTEVDIQELGLEQFHAMNLIKHIKEAYGTEIEVLQLYEEKTIHRIALFVYKTK